MDGLKGGDADDYEASVTTYVERYFDAVQNLPNDIQRLLSQIREFDTLTCNELRDYEERHQAYVRDIQARDNSARRKSHIELRRSLLRERQYGDEKLQLASQVQEIVEVSSKQLDEDLQMLEAAQLDAELARNGVTRDDHGPAESAANNSHNSDDKPGKRRKRPRPEQQAEAEVPVKDAGPPKEKVKKKKVAKKVSTKVAATVVEPAIVAPLPIDPNEPTYCLCRQISFGDMIGCDNDECPMEWFHFQCVGLTSKPKGKWYCPQCRRDQHRSENKHDAKSEKADRQKAQRTER